MIASTMSVLAASSWAGQAPANACTTALVDDAQGDQIGGVPNADLRSLALIESASGRQSVEVGLTELSHPGAMATSWRNITVFLRPDPGREYESYYYVEARLALGEPTFTWGRFDPGIGAAWRRHQGLTRGTVKAGAPGLVSIELPAEAEARSKVAASVWASPYLERAEVPGHGAPVWFERFDVASTEGVEALRDCGGSSVTVGPEVPAPSSLVDLRPPVRIRPNAHVRGGRIRVTLDATGAVRIMRIELLGVRNRVLARGRARQLRAGRHELVLAPIRRVRPGRYVVRIVGSALGREIVETARVIVKPRRSGRDSRSR